MAGYRICGAVIRAINENDEVIQTVEKRVETISNDCWTKWIEDFRIQQENELKLEFEEAIND